MTTSSAPAPPPRAKSRALHPREHGAYGQLALPLVAALASGRPGLSSLCLVCAAVALFVAHEPLLVTLGARGRRAKREHGARALRVAAGWTALALVTGLAGLWLGGDAVVRAALVPLVLVLVLVPFVVRGAEKTLAGEVIAAVTLAAAAIPVAVACGLSTLSALHVWAMWIVAFTVSTSAVRWVIATHKGRKSRVGLALATAMTLVAGIATSRTAVILAASPMVLLGWFVIARPPHPRHLRRIGWALVTCGALATLLVVLFVRLGIATRGGS